MSEQVPESISEEAVLDMSQAGGTPAWRRFGVLVTRKAEAELMSDLSEITERERAAVIAAAQVRLTE